jgi:hypothetical protein
MMDALGKEPETEIQSVTMDSISEIVELVSERSVTGQDV